MSTPAQPAQTPLSTAVANSTSIALQLMSGLVAGLNAVPAVLAVINDISTLIHHTGTTDQIAECDAIVADGQAGSTIIQGWLAAHPQTLTPVVTTP